MISEFSKLSLVFILLGGIPVCSAPSMFDDNGDYSGNWKQMTRVNTSAYQQKYRSSAYSTNSWNAQNKRAQSNKDAFSVSNYNQSATVPFRYNSLNYTRTRNVKGGHGEYNAKCSDIGDVSFCR